MIVEEQVSACKTKIWLNTAEHCVARFCKINYEIYSIEGKLLKYKVRAEGVSLSDFKKDLVKYLDYTLCSEVNG